MDGPELKTLRVLIVTAKPHVALILRQVLNIAGVTEVALCANGRDAIELLRSEVFDAAFCDDAVSRGIFLKDGVEDFGHAARRTQGLIDPMLPVFLVCAGPRRRDIETARDQGYTDVLTRPVSAATVARKLKLAVCRPRPFIVAPEFFGPDRRSQARGRFRGDDRRTRQPRKVRIAAPPESSV